MRTLATLATLLVGLAIVFWAPAAKAHCPNLEHCGEEPPGASNFVLVDNDGAGTAFGEILSIVRSDVVRVTVLLNDDDFTGTQLGGKTVALQIVNGLFSAAIAHSSDRYWLQAAVRPPIRSRPPSPSKLTL